MRPSLLAGALLALCTAAGLAVPAAAAAVPPPDDPRVAFDRDTVTAVVGDRFTLDSRITNAGAEATGPFVAHLNVVSRTPDVYVDPEDWSSERTLDVDALEPGESVPLAWDLQAVNAGTFAVYVVLLPDGAGPLTVSPPVNVTVAGRRTLTPGRALPVAVAVPLLLGLATVGVRFRGRIRRPGR